MSRAETPGRKRTQMLVELRQRHEATARKAQELLKHQQAERRRLQLALKAGPSTVPGLASATGLPPHAVLWHIASMKKYGLVQEQGTDESGDYYRYGLVKETLS